MKSQSRQTYNFTAAPTKFGLSFGKISENPTQSCVLSSRSRNMYLFLPVLLPVTTAWKHTEHRNLFHPMGKRSRARRETFACMASTSTGNIAKIALDLTGTALSSAGLHAMRHTYATSNAAITKGNCSHELGRRASETLRNAREQVRLFVGAATYDEIVFFPTAFDAMRTLASSYCQLLKREEEVILGDLGDKHSQLWKNASRQGLFRIVHATDMSLSSIAHMISSKTKLFVLRSASAFGNVHDLTDTLEFLQALEIPVILEVSDTLQYGHLEAEKSGVDFLISDCTGIGAPAAFLYGKKHRLERLPPAFGGEHAFLQNTCIGESGLDVNNWGPIPERFELGMPCLPHIASIGTVVERYNAVVSRPMTRNLFQDQANYLHEQLRSTDRLCVYGEAKNRAPFACFNVPGVDSIIVGENLKEHGVFVQVGYHDSRQAHENSNLGASLRVDVSLESHTNDDIDHFVGSLKAVACKLSTMYPM